jgi:hypothetical protein
MSLIINFYLFIFFFFRQWLIQGLDDIVSQPSRMWMCFLALLFNLCVK